MRVPGFLNESFYEGPAGQFAGSTSGFAAGIAFTTSKGGGGADIGLCGAFDTATGRGWKLTYDDIGRTLTATVAHTGGVLELTTTVAELFARTSLLHLEVDAGANAMVRVFLNGNAVISDNLGAGNSFRPAANPTLLVANAEGSVFASTFLVHGMFYNTASLGADAAATLWRAFSETGDLSQQLSFGIRPYVALSNVWGFQGFMRAGGSFTSEDIWLPSNGAVSLLQNATPPARNIYNISLYFSAALITGSSSDVPDNLFIATTGDDTNTGLTPADPLLTVARANAIVEGALGLDDLDKVVVYHFAEGSYVYEYPNISYGPLGLVAFYGDGAGQGGDGFTEIATGVTSGVSVNVWEALVAVPVVANAFLGYTIEFTNGAIAGYRRHVCRNTTANIFFTQSTGAVVPDATTFRILAPAVVLRNAADAPRDIGNNSNLGFVNVAFEGASASTLGSTWGGGRNTLLGFGVDTFNAPATSGFRLQPYESAVIMGMLTHNSYQALLSALLVALGTVSATNGPWQGWGITGLRVSPTRVSFPFSDNFLGAQAASFSGFYIGRWQTLLAQTHSVLGGSVTAAFINPAVACDFVVLGGYLALAAQAAIIVGGGALQLRSFSGGAIQAVERNGDALIVNTGGQLLTTGTGQTITANASGTTFRFRAGSLGDLQAACQTICTGTAAGIVAEAGSTVSVTGAHTINTNASSGLAVDAADGASLTFGPTSIVIGRVSNVGADIESNGTFTTLGTATALTVQGGSFRQAAGAFSATASAGSGVVASLGAVLGFSGGALTTIGGTVYGVDAQGASVVDFAGDLSGVSGTTADLRVDNSTVAAAVLAAAGDFVSGIPVGGSPGAGGGSRIGRSA